MMRKTILTFAGSLLALFVIIFKNSQMDPTDIILQLLFIMGIPILLGILISISIIERFSGLSELVNHPANRYLFTFLASLIIIIPLNKAFLLNDFTFIVLVIIIIWFWISWCYYFEKKKK